MDLVLIGLSGSGKTTLGRRLADACGAAFVDLDAEIEREAGASVAAIFSAEGERGFRARERSAVAALGRGDGAPRPTRVIAAGGGAVVDPRTRFELFTGRRVAWLDAPPAVLARRLDTDGGDLRPLLQGGDAAERLGRLLDARRRWYAAGERVDADAGASTVLRRLTDLATAAPARTAGTTLLRAETAVGTVSLGVGHAASALSAELRAMDRGRLTIVSERRAWRHVGSALAAAVDAASVEHILVPSGERAKGVAAWARLVRSLAALRLERGDPVAAVGGGALGDVAGFAAATYLRGVPLLQVPTTILAQIDSSIGGKTGIDLPEGKNLVGAFHQPRAIVLDLATVTTLPGRDRRSALGEAVKYAMLGDEALFRLLEVDGPSLIAPGPPTPQLAELVERCAWRKVEIVAGDEREQGDRVTLNLGHTIGHAIEAAAGFGPVLHGEAVAYGLRGAVAIGVATGVTPPAYAARVVDVLGALGLAIDAPAVDRGVVEDHLAVDKKMVRGRLRWVLPTGDGVTVRSDVPSSAVAAGITAALAGAGTARGPRR